MRGLSAVSEFDAGALRALKESRWRGGDVRMLGGWRSIGVSERRLTPTATFARGGTVVNWRLWRAQRFAEMLAAAEDAQLEGRVRSTEEALKMVREMFPR